MSVKGRATGLKLGCAHCRQPYVNTVLFYSVSVGFFVYITIVLLADARHKGVAFPLGSLAELVRGPAAPPAPEAACA